MDAPRHDIPAGGRSGFALVEGRQVHYLEWGRIGSPAVVCLHGGGQTAYMYEELGAALGERYFVLAPDLPGHGDSDPLLRGTVYGRQAMAATLGPLLDQLGIDRAAFVGASLGGVLSITLGASQPERVGAVALIDVGHRLEEEGVAKIIDFMAAHESFASLDEAATYIAEYLPYRKSFRPESLSRNLRQRDDGRWVWKHTVGHSMKTDIAPRADGRPDWQKLFEGVDDDAATLRVPVLVLRGARSDVLSGDGADELVALLHDGRLATVERAGHLAAGDNPNSTTNLISGFLSEAW
jgi:pimeloyl-ACP methyl ester carboxylesterase